MEFVRFNAVYFCVCRFCGFLLVEILEETKAVHRVDGWYRDGRSGAGIINEPGMSKSSERNIFREFMVVLLHVKESI